MKRPDNYRILPRTRTYRIGVSSLEARVAFTEVARALHDELASALGDSLCTGVSSSVTDVYADFGSQRRDSPHRTRRGRSLAPYRAQRSERRLMLALAPGATAVYLCVGPTDMRKAFDGLMRLAAEQARNSATTKPGLVDC
jgi:hypothetical protein